MRKTVVREEPFGNSPAVKVIYSDGTFGVRGVPSTSGPSEDEHAPHGMISDRILKAMSSSAGAAVSPEELKKTSQVTNDAASLAAVLREYIPRAGADLDTADPNAFESLRDTMRGTRKEALEETYREWLEAMQGDKK